MPQQQVEDLAYVSCRVEPGMFDDELLAFVDAVDPASPDETIVVQVLVDRAMVDSLAGKPERGRPVPGWLKVSLAGTENGFSVVVLPQPGIPVGDTMIVREETVREAAAG